MFYLLLAVFALRFAQLALTDGDPGTMVWWLFEVARWGAIVAIFVLAKGLWLDLARRLDRIIETVYDDRRWAA